MEDKYEGFIIYGLKKGGVLHEVKLEFDNDDALNKEVNVKRILGYEVFYHADSISTDIVDKAVKQEELDEDAKQDDNKPKKSTAEKSSTK